MTPDQHGKFNRFRYELIQACAMDAKLEYLGEKYYKSARTAWERADLAEKAFKDSLETI